MKGAAVHRAGILSRPGDLPQKKKPATRAGKITVGGTTGRQSLTTPTVDQLEFQRLAALIPHDRELQRLTGFETS